LSALLGPGGTAEEQLVALSVDARLRHQEVLEVVAREKAMLSEQSALEHGCVMKLVADSGEVTRVIAADAVARIAAVETRTEGLDEAQAKLSIQLQQVSTQLHTLHSVTVARLGGWGRGRGWGDAGEGGRERSSGENACE
jgi:hypothetical protein